MRAGNLTPKYPPRDPLAAALVRRWRRALAELVTSVAPGSVLDVGCGEGVLTAEWARRLPGASVLGVDVADPGLAAAWRSRAATTGPDLAAAGPDLAASEPERAASAERRPHFAVVAPAPPLPFADGAFDLVAAVESLEHMEDPAGALAEMARCARGHLLVSVPREPLWRALNLARGAHVRRLGDTPGHLHHFTPRALRALLGRHGRIVAMRFPIPWTVALARV